MIKKKISMGKIADILINGWYLSCYIFTGDNPSLTVILVHNSLKIE